MSMEFLTVKNQTETSADLYFYGDIVSDSWAKWTDEDTCPQDITDALKCCENADTLNIYINSGGGSVWAGIAIHNILKRCNAKKIVHIDGLAASIASVIALAGDELIMPANTFMMIHKAWTYTSGNADDLRAAADELDKIEQSIVKVYSDNCAEDVTEEHIKELMSAETWLAADETAKLFKNVTVTGGTDAVNCISDFTFGKMPDGITVKSKILPKTPPQKAEQNKQPIPDGEITNEALEKLKNFKNFLFLEEENENE